MKNRTKQCALIAGLIVSASVSVQARDVFRVTWHGMAYTTNQNGVIVARAYSQKDIINKYAADAGVDPQYLAVAYVHDEEEPAEEVEIVSAIDGSSIANVFQFLGGLAVSNSDGTRSRRQRFIFNEDHRSALGTLSGSERLRRNAEGEIISFSYQGRFEFSIPEEKTVYIGSFSTGRRID